MNNPIISAITSTNKINPKFLNKNINLNGVYSKSDKLNDYEDFCKTFKR